MYECVLDIFNSFWTTLFTQRRVSCGNSSNLFVAISWLCAFFSLFLRSFNISYYTFVTSSIVDFLEEKKNKLDLSSPSWITHAHLQWKRIRLCFVQFSLFLFYFAQTVCCCAIAHRKGQTPIYVKCGSENERKWRRTLCCFHCLLRDV